MADTVNGRMLSKNDNALKRFQRLLDALPAGFVFDGEIVALDEDGRPRVAQLQHHPKFGQRGLYKPKEHTILCDPPTR